MAHAQALLATFVLLSWLARQSCSWTSESYDNYVIEACSVTRYQDLCIDSLASYSNTAKKDPSKWARAGVSVTIGEAKNTTRYLVGLKKKNHLKGRNRLALSDCVDVMQDSLTICIRVLRTLSDEVFETQMEDITTWISSALTDEDTCLDGFGGQNGKHVKLLARKC
ncbi:LOW QUALITY PROTEIN: hypothetical protein OSB04_un001400 [Centaurea solstitialis]|uniref:Pectinesterase inhibitor domain-containing protein n=1 Tax=Centaurea solstitialis TaxID=347529 RepID=A0AA38W2N0_9ASTR|nr:LOW QUALITY PROTEIN: hypothetical protein OSB04_un001400 [Centaurea solstitialis]